MKNLILVLLIISITSCVTNKSPNSSRKHHNKKIFTKAYSGSSGGTSCTFKTNN